MNILDVINKSQKPLDTGLGLEDKMPFGKYKSMTIQEVMMQNISYIEWAMENVKSFVLSNTAFRVFEREHKAYSRRKMERDLNDYGDTGY